MPPKTVNCIKFFTKYWNINARFFLNLGFEESFNGAQLLKFGQIRSRGSTVIGVKN